MRVGPSLSLAILVADIFRASGFTTRTRGTCRNYCNILSPAFHLLSSVKLKRRGEEPEINLEQFQDPDNEYGLFASTTYKQDDEEADRVYEEIMLWIPVEGLRVVF